MNQKSINLITTLILDDIENSLFKISGIRSEKNRHEEMAIINPDADYSQEINECLYSIAHFNRCIDNTSKVFKDFKSIKASNE